MHAKNFVNRRFIVGLAFVALAFQMGCGSNAVTTITLTGTLDGSREGRVLANYKVKCVTLTNPGTSGTATTDASGLFSLQFAAGNVPFSCFVLNPSDVQIASFYFTSTTESASGFTIKIGASTDLGTVTVNTARGTATATVAAGLSLNPAKLECPVGIWTGSVGVNTLCSGDSVATTLWLGKDSAGAYVLSHALSPHKQGSCGVSAFAPTGGTVTYANNVLSWGLNFGHAATAEATVASDCSEISIKFVQNGCGTCAPSGADLTTQCLGVGSINNCQSNSFVLTKK